MTPTEPLRTLKAQFENHIGRKKGSVVGGKGDGPRYSSVMPTGQGNVKGLQNQHPVGRKKYNWEQEKFIVVVA